MTTVDLTTTHATPENLLDGLPRRVALTLPELRLVAERAGNAPLPFDVTEPRPGALEDRMGQSRGSSEDAAYLTALATLHEPVDSLSRRGLVPDGVVDSGLAGAVGLLATPAVALDLDVRVGEVQAKAWHREAAGAVATLATVDGIVFELAWFDIPQWPQEVSRAGMVPDGPAARSVGGARPPRPAVRPGQCGAEAMRTGRSDLLPVLVAQHTGRSLDADGSTGARRRGADRPGRAHDETRGRLRALVTDVGPGERRRSWAWSVGAGRRRVATPSARTPSARSHGSRSVASDAADLPAELAPVLAEVAR